MTLNEKKIEFSKLSYPKWKRVGYEGASLDTKDLVTYSKTHGREDWQKAGVKLHHISHENLDLADVFSAYEDMIKEIDDLPFGTDLKYKLEGETSFGTGYLIHVPEGVILDTPLIIDYSFDKDHRSLVENTFIYMGKGSQAKIILRYKSEDVEGYHNGLTRVYADEDSYLQLVKFQNLSETAVHIDNSVSYIKRRGKVVYNSFDFGGKRVVSNYSAHLIGDEASADTQTAYLASKDQRFDIGYASVHHGMRTESNIETKGALMDRARKIFRGDLKFEKGSKKSLGSESEYVLLLDKTVQSDAIPALLCDEDDVSGEHAASAGQVSEQQLFYLMSRGFTLKEAKKLIIHGSFSSVLDLMPTEELKMDVEEILERRLAYASS